MGSEENGSWRSPAARKTNDTPTAPAKSQRRRQVHTRIRFHTRTAPPVEQSQSPRCDRRWLGMQLHLLWLRDKKDLTCIRKKRSYTVVPNRSGHPAGRIFQEDG